MSKREKLLRNARAKVARKSIIVDYFKHLPRPQDTPGEMATVLKRGLWQKQLKGMYRSVLKKDKYVWSFIRRV